MTKEIKTFEERKQSLLELGKKNGFITYEQLADELKGLEVDSDSLDDLYNFLVDNNIEITVLEIRGDQIKIGISAPKDVPIYRKEVYLQIQQENEAAISADGLDALNNLLD